MIQSLQKLWLVIRPASATAQMNLALLFATATLAELGLVVVLNRALADHANPTSLPQGVAAFVLAVVVWAWAERRLFQDLEGACNEASLRIRFGLVDRLRRAPLRRVEALGKESAHFALTGETQSIATAGTSFGQVIRAVARLSVSLVYGVALSAQGAGLAAMLLLAVGVSSWYQMQSLIASMGPTFSVEARLRALLSHFVEGVAAMRQHDPRRAAVMATFTETLGRLAQARMKGFSVYFEDGHRINVLFFSLLGLIAFTLPTFGGEDADALRALNVVVLWAATGIYDLVFELPRTTDASAALERLLGLQASLEADGLEARSDDPTPLLAEGRFEALSLQGLTFSYCDAPGRPTFSVGPIHTHLRAGELVLVTGPNGAGKSTFVKLLAGLYAPDGGQRSVNGRPVAPSEGDRYRELFGYVPAEVHIFEQVYGMRPGQQAEADALLARLEIAHKTGIKDGRITHRELSTGQRQRLAMVLVLLQDRPVLIFDEWAATQDPEHREMFYNDLLPTLRAQGRLVVVVTHDDRYFDRADRRLIFADGQLNEIGGAPA